MVNNKNSMNGTRRDRTLFPFLPHPHSEESERRCNASNRTNCHQLNFFLSCIQEI